MPIEFTATVTLLVPVVGMLEDTVLLAENAKLNASVMLFLICPEVRVIVSFVQWPIPSFPLVELEDTQRVALPAPNPALIRGDRFTAPTDDTRTVMLTEAVVGKLEALLLLIASETIVKLKEALELVRVCPEVDA